MWKRFTDRLVATLTASALTLTVAGCMSTSRPSAVPATDDTATAATPMPEKAERRGRGWLPGSVFGGRDEAAVDGDRTSGDLPRVNGRNAAAFDQAVAQMKAQRWSEAEALLRGITDDQPELAGPWVNLGQVYLQLQQPEEARLAFRNAIAANPENCAAYNQLGVLFRTQGQFTEAEAQYLKCLSGKPDFADVYLNLGILYELYLGRLPEALEAYRKYQVLVPEPDRKVAGWVMDLERRTRN